MTQLVETIETPATETEAADTPIPPTEPQTPKDGQKPAEGETAAEPPKPTEQQLARREEMRALARAKSSERRALERAHKAERERGELDTARKADLERVQKAEEIAARFKDPGQALKALEAAGLTAQDLVKASFAEGTPEAILAKVEALAEKKARAIVDEYKAEQQKEREETTKRTQAQRQEHERAEASKWFQGFIEKHAETYPATAKLIDAMPDYAMSQAFRVYAAAADEIERARRIGREITYTDEECAQALEKVLSPMYNKIIGQPNPSPKPKSQSESNGAATGSAAAISVTSGTAGALGSMSDLPKDFRNWSADRQNEYWIQQAQQSLKR
jgi:hypothetical protein